MLLGAFIIPTGIGCSIGGHAGDANPAVKLISSCCDRLIVNPNAVNGSDINEMPENCLYVEGSMIDKFLARKAGFRPVMKPNHIVVAVNGEPTPTTINAVNAAKVTVGIEASYLALKETLTMEAFYDGKLASGRAAGVTALIDQVREVTVHGYLSGRDAAIAIHTEIISDKGVAMRYFEQGGVNPWGKVESMVSAQISQELGVPVAHAPIELHVDDESMMNLYRNAVVDPRMAPEVVSHCYLHCVLKGLHRAPQPVPLDYRGSFIAPEDIGFLISPDCEFSRPHWSCIERKVPVIIVRENKTVISGDSMIKHDLAFWADSYLDAAGMVQCMGAGVNIDSVRARK